MARLRAGGDVVLRGRRPFLFPKRKGEEKGQREAQPSLWTPSLHEGRYFTIYRLIGGQTLWTPSLHEGRSHGAIKIKMAFCHARKVQAQDGKAPYRQRVRVLST